MTPFRVARTAREVLLTSGAVVGALCLLLGLAALAFGLTPLIFRSGSMSPTIATGALAVARAVDAADLAEGDIVSVHNTAGSRITHRVVAVAGSGAARELTLRGDANDVADPESYVVTEADRVVVAVPRVGYVVGWLSGPVGLFLLGAYAMFLLSVLWRPGGAPGPSSDTRAAGGRRAGPRSRRRSRRRGSGAGGRRRADRRPADRPGMLVASALLLGAGSTAAVAGRTVDTLAAFTDAVPVSAGYTATTIAAPAPVTCSPGGFLSFRVTFSWPAVSGATGYTVRYGNGAAQSADTPATTFSTPPALVPNGTAWVEAHRNFGSTTWTSPASTSLTYTASFISDC